MFNFEVDPCGDGPFRIADRQALTAQRGCLPGFDARRPNTSHGSFGGDLLELELLQLLLLRFGPGGGTGPRLVLGDEFFQVLALGQHPRIHLFQSQTLFFFVFQIGVDLAGKHRQFPTGQVQRVAASRLQEGPVVRHDQAGFLVTPQEMLQQDLGAQVEKVRWFIQQQQVRLVQQQCGQLDARLPTTGELGDRPVEIVAFQLELAGDLAALPVGLAAVTHQEFLRGLARQKRIVLAQVPQPQPGVADDLATVEFFLTEQNAKQGAFSGPVAADKPHLHVVRQRRLGPVEKHLTAIRLVKILQLQQHGHRTDIPGNEATLSPEKTRTLAGKG